jgi:hypothetical protein
MGNITSCSGKKNNMEDEEEELYNLTDIENIIHKYNCSIADSTYKLIQKDEKYNLYLCDNDLILKNRRNEFRIIYNNIIYWTSAPNFFGFVFKNLKNKEEVIIQVDNSNNIANNLKKITYDLVYYYKNI